MQRRQDKVRETKIVEPESDELMVISSDVAQLQRQDPTLAALLSKCVPNSTEVTERVGEVFLIKQLYRRSRVGDQLVVEKEFEVHSFAASSFCTLGSSFRPTQNLLQNDNSLLLATTVCGHSSVLQIMSTVPGNGTR